MVIQNQLSHLHHVTHFHHENHFKVSPLFPLFHLHHYHQENLMIDSQMSTIKSKSSLSTSSPSTTKVTKSSSSSSLSSQTPSPAPSSFYIDDLLGINRSSINRKNNHLHHQNHHNQPIHINTTTTTSNTPIDATTITFPPSTSPHSVSSCKKSKRIRTIFTQEQLDILEKIFTHTQYMVGGQRAALSESLGLSDTQVKVWFQNRRIKQRKEIVKK